MAALLCLSTIVFDPSDQGLQIYDFFLKSEHELGLLIADVVSGHGVPAALIASMVKLAASTQRANADDRAELLLGMNRALFGHTQSQFVTAGYV